MQSLIDQVLQTSLAEWVAVILALGYVWLAASQHILCWLCAAVSTAIYTVLFWNVALPFQSALNGYYLVMAAYGFWQWRSGGQHDGALAVSPMPLLWHPLLVVGSFAIAWAIASLFTEVFHSDYLYIDAWVTIASVITTLLVAKKKVENWLYWIVINSVAAWLYFQTGLTLTSGLFLLYIGFAVYGFFQWRNTLQKNEDVSSVEAQQADA